MNENKPNKPSITKPNAFHLMDASLLPLIQSAESGCIDSQEELFLTFADGINSTKNYEMAEYFLDLALDTVNNTFNVNPKAKYSILWNKVMLTNQKGDFETTKSNFSQMIEFMLASVPVEEWDFSQFDYIKNIIDENEA